MCDCKTRKIFIVTLLIVLCVVLVTKLLPDEKSEESTLELVHVLFRHGDRTTEPLTIYPKDPYKNETYYPYGVGELTDKGKDRVYDLGKSLYRRYDKLLGGKYIPDIVGTISSPYHRTELSLELVLAGLFSSFNNYQPINNWPNDTDKIFLSIVRCPNFQKFFGDAVNSQELQPHRETLAYLTENTGKKIETCFDTYYLFMCLKSEEEWGLTLPDWTHSVYPKILEQLTVHCYQLLTSTPGLRRFISGYFLKKIIQDSKDKASEQLFPGNRKLFLYSGHDMNIATVLNTLDIFQEDVPPYAAYVAFELHRIGGNYGFKIFYENFCYWQPRLLKLPDCEEFCPLDKFVALVEDYLPKDDTCGDET